MKAEQFETEIGGRKLIIKTGELAGQAHGSCTVQYGDTLVLCTAVMGTEPREGINFFPLLVDYEERLYAAGKIKGSRFIKREGRPSDEAILTDRLVDRSIRPLFPADLKNDVQVVITVLSCDQENDPDILALLAASCALGTSDIPWHGPMAGVRIGQINGEWVLNPTYEAREKSVLDLVLVGKEDKILMIEAGAQEVPEKVVLGAIKFGQKHLNKIFKLIHEFIKKKGKEKKVVSFGEMSEEEKKTQEKIEQKVKNFITPKLEEIFILQERSVQKEKIDQIKEELEEVLKEDNEVTKEERVQSVSLVDEMIAQEARKRILTQEKRVDDRNLTQIRKITCGAGVLPRTHGSGLFNRGETQVMSIVTLGSPSSEQILDTMEESGKKRFMHHYNFPGFSVGEVSPIRAPGRREIGHGSLVEKALEPVLPKKEDFPYTIRVVSEVLSSNGSTSMASTCSSSLALMDAGVPVKEAVAGIAMGLIMDKENEKIHKILVDIQGVEDHAGDMDFKVAGTKNGLTALQLDMKVSGVPFKILEATLEQAKKTRLEILEKMKAVLSAARPDLSPYAPRITTLQINPEKIRDVIGPGGKIINEIIDKTGVTIDIEDDGLVMVTATDPKGAEKAVTWIKNLTREVKVGEIFQGKVKRILDFGAFVEILPNQEGLVHISELADYRVRQVTDVVHVDDIVPVKVIKIDEQGRINLSMRKNPSSPPPREKKFVQPRRKPFLKNKPFHKRRERR